MLEIIKYKIFRMELSINVNKIDIDKKVVELVEHELNGLKIGCDASVTVKQVVGKYLR